MGSCLDQRPENKLKESTKVAAKSITALYEDPENLKSYHIHEIWEILEKS
jgi:hypothetical protein